MELSTIFQQLGIAVGLGLLVGLQRERTSATIAGLRTFPLITVLGVLSGMLSKELGGWVLAGAFVALAGTMAVGNLLAMREGETDPGITTEVAMLVMFAVGAAVVALPIAVVLVIGGGVAVLLQFKSKLHGFASRLGEADLTAIMRFALIALVILPVLPNRPFGPFQVLNLFEIWLMVVLIVGISLAAFIVLKFFGQEAGTLIGGILGGLISSTATTVSWAERTRKHGVDDRAAAAVIMIASTVLVARVLVEIALFGPALLPAAIPPLGALFAVFVALSIAMWMRSKESSTARTVVGEPPSELGPALFFGALYAVVLVAVAAAKAWSGDRGLFAVAAISGLTDVDAITLSTSRLAETGHLGMTVGWKVILVGALSNTIFKGATVALLGTRRLFALVGTLYGVAFVAGALILAFWP